MNIVALSIKLGNYERTADKYGLMPGVIFTVVRQNLDFMWHMVRKLGYNMRIKIDEIVETTCDDEDI